MLDLWNCPSSVLGIGFSPFAQFEEQSGGGGKVMSLECQLYEDLLFLIFAILWNLFNSNVSACSLFVLIDWI